MMTSDSEGDETTVAIRVEYETAGGDNTAFTRYIDNRAPETIAETIALCPQGALVEEVQINGTERSNGGDE